MKVGDYVTLTGIVYEDGTAEKSGGIARIQTASGAKVKGVNPDDLAPASPAEIKKYQAAAVEGMTPEAIIAREEAETAKYEAMLKGDSGEDEPED
jgi:hypothetical protein